MLLPSLQSFHSFQFAHHCENVVVLQDQNDLVAQFRQLIDSPYYLLGEGTNTAFVEDYAGSLLINHLRGVRIRESRDAWLLDVASGENWHDLVTRCMQQGINGLENLALIPGSVGAAPVQNIGAYGREIDSFISALSTIDLQTMQEKVWSHAECAFGYRDSIFKQLGQRYFITQVHFTIPKDCPVVANYGPLQTLSKPSHDDVFQQVIAIRRQKLPDYKVLGNAGSFFKNPLIGREQLLNLQATYPNIPFYVQDEAQVKIPAAWLIDQAGFKGTSLGGIQCHLKQPLVLVNKGKGTGQQLMKMARKIQSTIYQEFAIKLENEVRLIGREGPITL